MNATDPLKTTEYWQTARATLDERALRLTAANAAKAYGHGGIQAMSRLSRLSRQAIARGMDELEKAKEAVGKRPSGKGVRRKGSGRTMDPALHERQMKILDALIEPHVRGDPMICAGRRKASAACPAKWPPTGSPPATRQCEAC